MTNQKFTTAANDDWMPSASVQQIREPGDFGTPGDVGLYVDGITSAAVSDMGYEAWFRYFYRAINGLLMELPGHDCLDFMPMAMGPYESPYIEAPFAPGSFKIIFFGPFFDRIEAAAKSRKQTKEQFALEALQKWARIPRGRAPD